MNGWLMEWMNESLNEWVNGQLMERINEWSEQMNKRENNLRWWRDDWGGSKLIVCIFQEIVPGWVFMSIMLLLQHLAMQRLLGMTTHLVL